MEIIRNYYRKAGDLCEAHDVGTVTLTVPNGKWLLDGKELSPDSIEYLATFALQCFQDAYAGQDELEGKARWQKKVDAVVNGTIGLRGTGDGASMETIVGRSVMRNAFKVRVHKDEGKNSPKWAEFTALSDAGQLAKLDAWLAGPQGVAIADALAKEIDLRKARAANKVDAAKNVTFDL